MAHLLGKVMKKRGASAGDQMSFTLMCTSKKPNRKPIFRAPHNTFSTLAWFFSGRTVAWTKVYAWGRKGGGGHRGLGLCSPSMSGVSWGLWVALVGVQSPREAWAALRWARRWVMEKPAFPSSWESTTSTCLQGDTESKGLNQSGLVVRVVANNTTSTNRYSK